MKRQEITPKKTRPMFARTKNQDRLAEAKRLTEKLLQQQ